MPQRHASASCVSPQLQTRGGLSSALSFKNPSQTLNIYYLSPALRCGATQSSECVPCFFFFVFLKYAENPAEISPTSHKLTRFIWLLRPPDGLISVNSRLFETFCWTELKKNTKNKKERQSLAILFESCWIYFAPPPPTHSPLWPQQLANLTFSREKVKSFQRAVSESLLLFINWCFMSLITKKRTSIPLLYLLSSFGSSFSFKLKWVIFGQ